MNRAALARISYQILGKIGGMWIRTGAEERLDNVLEHGQVLHSAQADPQTVEIFREVVRNPG